MKRVAMAITFAIAFYLGTVFSHPNAWFTRATKQFPLLVEKAGMRASVPLTKLFLVPDGTEKALTLECPHFAIE
jgi:hypothetical protein